MRPITLMLTGALVGAAAALLLAPESGEDLRARIKELLRRKAAEAKEEEGELETLMAQISQEIEEQ